MVEFAEYVASDVQFRHETPKLISAFPVGHKPGVPVGAGVAGGAGVGGGAGVAGHSVVSPRTQSPGVVPQSAQLMTHVLELRQ